MKDSFGQRYADAYDALYADKDYEAECDLIESLARRYGLGSSSILDLGCGTGRHAVALARRGRKVTGVDLSAEMIAIAQRRADEAGLRDLDLRIGDVRTVRIGRRFDLAILMFAVLGYQVTDADVEATLETAAVHLKPGAALVFDVWNGPAVEAIGPTQRTKTVTLDGMFLRRSAIGALDRTHRTCVVNYKLEWLSGNRVVRSDREHHRMRYFFGDEIDTFAAGAGLDVVASGSFPSMGRPASDTDWNAAYVLAKPP